MKSRLEATNKHNTIICVLLVFVFLTGCRTTTSQNHIARTYYESLSLDSPESAVETFTNAFQKEDFFTVFLILSPSTQLRVENNINTLNYIELISVKDLAEAEKVLANTPQFQMLSEWEHLGAASSYLFDAIMLAAKQHSVLLIDLSGDMSISRSERIKGSDGSPKVDVFTTIEGIEGDVIFRMEQAPSGRWRVRQVIVSGGNEELIPWSGPND
jgi:hypothetical protein